MNLQNILRKEIAQITPSEEETQFLYAKIENILRALQKEIKLSKIKADFFVGGSFAKETLIKRDAFDIDLFVRFSEQGDLSALLENVLKRAAKQHHWKLQRYHGSRDYFRIFQGKITFEIIPVKHIKSVKEAENITDLSVFHVFYVQKKLAGKKHLENQIRLAKQFCFAQGCYGAESYIQGFSGYALELLVLHYGSFVRFLRAVAGKKEKILLDPEHYYLRKEAILQEMNEAKLQSPLVFVDPVHKERNVLAALSETTFRKFQESALAFLKKPSLKFFQPQKIEVEKLKKEARRRKAVFLAFEMHTQRQEGDIAGTKMLKFSRFLSQQYMRYFDLLKKEFVYSGGQRARFYLLVKMKKKILIRGPPITSLEHLKRFKKLHPRAFVQEGIAYAHEKSILPDQFFRSFLKKQESVMGDMGITSLKRV